MCVRATCFNSELLVRVYMCVCVCVFAVLELVTQSARATGNCWSGWWGEVM